MSNLRKIFYPCYLHAAVAWSSSDNTAIRYVFPVLRMTLCSYIIGHMASGVDNNDMDDVLKKVVKISNVFARERHAV